MKTVQQIVRDIRQHWVGDGFPVRSLFSYGGGNRFDPFLLMDYAGPHTFEPATAPRGVEKHPHRGFETVTIVYQGELAHRDSSGAAGVIGTGDVQWMTAASGVIHEEFHSERFTRDGGTLEMVQLWVNLPAKDKRLPPKYQELLDGDFPRLDLPGQSGSVRVIAGDFQGTRGPAQTFTDINVWDLQLSADADWQCAVPAGHTCLLVVQQGQVQVQGQQAQAVELVELSRDGDHFQLASAGGARVLLLSGLPIGEPVVGQGPFVMNTRDEIRQAITDYTSGRMGQLS